MLPSDIHTHLLRRIVFLALLIILSATLITGTIYLEERLPGPLLDKSINFHSVVMHDTNKLVMYIGSVLHDMEYKSETNAGLQQIANIDYTLNKFFSGINSLYQKYEFPPGVKTLAKLREESSKLRLLISQASGKYPADLYLLQNQIKTVVDGLQQLYRLHEADDNGIRAQLVRYQKHRAITVMPLITAILLLTGFLGYQLIRRIFQSLAVQNKLENILRETAASHRQILNSMYVFVGLFTVDGRFVELNESPLMAAGLKREDVLGKEIWETYWIAFSQESKETCKSLFTRAAAGEVVRQDLKVRIKGEQFIILDGTFSPVYDSGGRIVNVIGSGVDITERKRAEEEETKKSLLSLQYKEVLLALSQQQFDNLHDHFHAITEAAAKALNVERVGLWTLNNNTLECEDQYLAPTGEHQHIVPYTLSDSSPYFNALRHQEVIRADDARTDPRTSEFSLMFKLRDIHSWMDVPIWAQGKMVGLLGCDHTGMLRHWTDLEEEFARHLAALASVALEAEERRRAEKTIKDINENLEQRVEERTAELSIANAKLERAMKAAASANEAKSEFLSRMSHELRTPLHAIMGFSQLLEGSLSHTTQEEKQSMRQIHHSGQHLLALINEVLDLTRIEAGNLELFLEDIDLADGICMECLEQVRGLAEKNNIALQLQAGTSPAVVFADRLRLKQVLINLLSNAVKYNRPEGSVTLEYLATGKRRVRVTVTDTGMGIARDRQDRVFQPFVRIHREGGAAIEGTGIGLTITRRLVEAMGGEIGFTSAAGTGTAFWFELRAGRKTPRAKPLTTAAVAKEGATSAVPATRGTVLYVEDTAANVHLMRLIVKRLPGVELLDAGTAELGMVLTKEAHPDLILMDIDLPGMDGIAALQRLRQDAETRNIPVIAVSAAAMAHDLERIQQAGFDDILSKPFNIQAVPALLAKHLSNRRDPGSDPK